MIGQIVTKRTMCHISLPWEHRCLACFRSEPVDRAPRKDKGVGFDLPQPACGRWRANHSLYGLAFLRGHCRKGGDHLLHLFPMTLRTLYLCAVVFFDRQDDIKLLITRLTMIFVARHNPLLPENVLTSRGLSFSGPHTCGRTCTRWCVTVRIPLSAGIDRAKYVPECSESGVVA